MPDMHGLPYGQGLFNSRSTQGAHRRLLYKFILLGCPQILGVEAPNSTTPGVPNALVACENAETIPTKLNEFLRMDRASLKDVLPLKSTAPFTLSSKEVPI